MRKATMAATALLLTCTATFAQQKSTFTDSRDKKTYKTVNIGRLAWMAENLNYDVKGSVCLDNNNENCTKCGRLYSWSMAKTACPSGWRLPSQEELDNLGASSRLRDKSWSTGGTTGYGTDNYGFSALPCGAGYLGGSFDVSGRRGDFWSATEQSASHAYNRNMYDGLVRGWRGGGSEKSYLYSVRCVKNLTEAEAAATREAKAATREAEAAAAREAKAAVVRAAAVQKGSFTDSRDNKKYKSVKIAKQTWMAENLNYNASGSKCYEDKNENCTQYGRLYNWETAKTACPKGWHLPSTDEYKELEKSINVGSEKLWEMLRAKNGWKEYPGNGTDDFGFSAIPGGGGLHDFGGRLKFQSVGSSGYWWTANIGGDIADIWKCGYSGDNQTKSNFFSVRCVQDDGTTPSPTPAPSPALTPILGAFTDPRDKKTYKTAKIYNYTWMAENLNYDVKSSACYNNNCKKYGKLYDWNMAMKACPEGWRLPSNAEWLDLVTFAGGSEIAGKKLKAKSGWDKCNGEKTTYVGAPGNTRFINVKYDACGTDDYKFSALPNSSLEWGKDVANKSDWWTATENGSYGREATNAYIYSMDSYSEKASLAPGDKSGFGSVRCVHDGGAKNAPTPTLQRPH